MAQPAVVISRSSGGIGLATVDRFLAGGYQVLGVDLVDPPGARTGLRTVKADVRDPRALQAAVDSLGDEFDLRHVVGLAGRPLPEELEVMEQPPGEASAHFTASVDLKLTGQFTWCAAPSSGWQLPRAIGASPCAHRSTLSARSARRRTAPPRRD